MDLKEEAIWKKIQKKDGEAFRRYYLEHFKAFFLMSCKYLRDPSQAEEVVNDVFLKIWEDGHLITIESSLKSYIYKAIINRSINAFNKNQRDSLHHSEMINLPEESYELRQIEENELAVKLYAAIDELPDKCRQVFEMSRFEELKQQDIADRLGISIKTVKNHITLALKQLSKSIMHSFLLLFMLIEYIYRH